MNAPAELARPDADVCETEIGGERVWVAHPGEVEAFLEKHAKLRSELAALVGIVRKRFGPEPEIWLRLNADPEIVDVFLRIEAHFAQSGKGRHEILHSVWDDFEPFSSPIDDLVHASIGHRSTECSNGV